MNPEQIFLFQVVENSLSGKTISLDRLGGLAYDEIARLLATSYFLTSAIHSLEEHHWILTRGDSARQSNFQTFLNRALRRELSPFYFLEPLLEDLTPAVLRRMSADLDDFTKKIGAALLRLADADYQKTLKFIVRAMGSFCSFEENLVRTDDFLAPSLYRAFDGLDDLFAIHFEGDQRMKAHASERLYEGAGREVQTSYAQIFSVLDHLKLREGAHLVDLGSGFGRMGLVAGLWRDDLKFTGYEFFGHRVDVSRASTKRLGLSDRVSFYEQDLSDPNFKIPSADVYYMYDPFTAETYERVIARLLDVGRTRAVSVVTKGHAGESFAKIASTSEWRAPEKFDGGVLWIFRSKIS